tara:strand:+ start:84 stop:614 length:531 start_codon:yes stop_codon:yes gene_type:complete
MPTTPNISLVEKTKSETFMNSLTKLMEIVEKIAEKIPENDYLEFMNELKNLYDCKTENPIQEVIAEINVNEIVNTHRRRTGMNLRKQPNYTDNHKKICKYCDSKIVAKYMSDHIKTKKCKRIRETKTLSAYSSKVETDKIYVMKKHLKHLYRRFDIKFLLNDWKQNKNEFKFGLFS